MSSWSIRLFRIFGIKLELHLTFLLLWGLFAMAGWASDGPAGLVWASVLLLLIFTCVVLHELGHSLVARYYRIPVVRILLLPFGGMAQFARIPRNPRQEILISVAGPAVNVLIVLLLLPWAHLRPFGPHQALPLDLPGLLQALLVLNVVMGLFNLLPIFPMDGGRILRAALATRLPYLKATTIAVGIAKALAVAGILFATFELHNPFLTFLFAFIYMGGTLEHRMVKRRETTSGIFVRDLTRKHCLSIPSTGSLAAAADLFDAFHPGEILVLDGSVPRGYLTEAIVRKAIKQGREADSARDHCIKKFSVLQAGWPLDPFVEMIAQSPQRIYPVYAFGDLIGFLDAKNLDNLIASHRMRKMTPRDPTETSDSLRR